MRHPPPARSRQPRAAPPAGAPPAPPAGAPPEALVRSPRGAFAFIAGDFIGQHMAGGQHWEENMLAQVLPLLGPDRPPGVVLDVGANVGTHAVPYARLRPTFAFEPNPPILRLLARNVAANGVAENVVLYSAAVGSHAGTARISGRNLEGEPAGYSGDPFNYGGLALGAGGARVPVLPLDALGLPRVRYIKVDAEGAEPLVLWGARALVARDRPVIWFEQNQCVVTPEMLAELRAGAPGADPAELAAAADFDFVAYCAALGYAPPVPLGPTDFLLLPPGEAL